MKNQKKERVLANLFWAIKFIYKFENKYLLVLIIESFMNGITPVVTLLLTQSMINSVQIGSGSFQEVIMLLFYLIFFEIISNMLLRFSEVQLNNYELKLEAYIQLQILKKVSTLDCKDFENSNTYDLVNRAQYDADMGVLGNIKSLFAFISLAITSVSYMVILFNYNIIILSVIILIPIIRYYFEKKYNLLEYGITKDNTELERKTSYISFLLTNSENFKEIKMFDLFSYFIEEYEKIKDVCNNKLIKLHNTRTKIFCTLETIELCIDFIVILTIIRETFIGGILIGEFILYNNAVNSLKQNLISIFSCLSVAYKNNAVVEQIRLFFELSPEKINEKGIMIEEIKEIELRNLSYKYRGATRYTLSNINLKLTIGDFVILMGYNGSGKSTLVKILMGIYNDYEGEIYVNNVNRKKVNMKSYRKKVGSLFQDYIKYEMTVPENIWYGNLKYENNYKKISQILLDVKMSEEVCKSNQTLGYQFNDGRQLSIGQWQKLALARTLITDADFYIFDEPNSALDLISESDVFKTIYNKVHEKISIIIMHRFNAVVYKANRIVVLENGSIKETGTHQELLSQKGLYYKLFVTQKNFEPQKRHEADSNEIAIRHALQNVLPPEIKVEIDDNLYHYLNKKDIKFLIEILKEETGKQLNEQIGFMDTLTIKILMEQLDLCN